MRAPARTFSHARRLRREMTLPEVLLWTRLRRGGINGTRWRRQHPIGPYVLDFYCPSARLAVEVDGAAHDIPGIAAADKTRDAWLAAQGIRILRIPARQVLRDVDLDDVLATIAAAIAGTLD